MPAPAEESAVAVFAAILPHIAWATLPGGSAVWLNRRWSEFVGRPVAELLEKGWFDCVHPEHVERVRRRFDPDANSNAEWAEAFPLRAAEGGYRWFHARARAEPGAPGHVRRWVLSAADETEARQRDAEIKLGEKRYRSLVEAVSNIVWRAASDGRLIGDTTAWRVFTGQSEEEVEQLGWMKALHPDDQQATLDAWRAAVESKSLYKVEHRVKRYDGIWRHMSASAAPVFDAADAIIEWVGFHVDITEQKKIALDLQKAKEVAEEANLAKSQFIANMSHELRTPLSAVIGYTELLEEELEDSPAKHLLEDLRKIDAAARHLLSMISDVLDLSKIEANRMSVYPETFPVAGLVKTVTDTVHALIEKNGNRLETEGEEWLGALYTDQVKLRQCLLNLLSNAAKFTHNGLIKLIIRRFQKEGADWIEFSVKDSGIGMAQDQLDKLFQRFVQADDSTTRRYGGTGLGLSITRAFVRLLGGEVDVSSIEGEGSTFTIRIPCELETAPSETIEEPDGDPKGDRVLIVDDDAATRDLVGRYLQKEGFAVLLAENGTRGLAKAKKYKPRVILLDVMMPESDGWSVLSQIRRDPELRETPVIVISFVHEQGLAASLGANDYLSKPVDFDELNSVLQRYRSGPSEGDVLVVDDDADARQRVATMLNRAGFHVRVAADGEAALEACEQARPAVVLLDLVMPGMDGFAVLKALRAKPKWRDINVVVLTAKDIEDAEREFLQAEADQILTKGSTTYRELAEQLRGLGVVDSEGGTGS